VLLPKHVQRVSEGSMCIQKNMFEGFCTRQTKNVPEGFPKAFVQCADFLVTPGSALNKDSDTRAL
jgi:hypothetical protein